MSNESGAAASSSPAAGLAGAVAGDTAIATVGKAGAGLTYRGYAIEELAERTIFDEVAFLLLHGELPTPDELADFQQRLAMRRGLPHAVRLAIEACPSATHPMDVLRTGVSMLGCVEPEADANQQVTIAERLLACMPTMLAHWHRHHAAGSAADTALAPSGSAAGFLHMLKGANAAPTAVAAMEASLILYAEHEFNASTFTARVIAATLSDMHSAVTGAIGALRGPLHGGANEAAMELIERYADPDAAEAGIMDMLSRKELVMGFGHRVYRNGDPRSPIIHGWAKRLAGDDEARRLLGIAERIHAVVLREKGLHPNLDFYSALVYRSLGIPTPLFTPVFALARVTGWTAHVMEQRANNKLIRPAARYVGPERRMVTPIKDRVKGAGRS